MSHHCHATNCNIEVIPEMFMCRKHWFMLPKTIRNKIWATYRNGQCDDMNPSKSYCETAKNAVIWLANKEGIKPDTQLYDFLMHNKE